jgi:5-methylcytosine-specific restriction endonuclease McrA
MPRSAEETRRAKRLQMAKRRADDPAAARAYQRKWHGANRERNLATMRDYYARRFFWGRAMKLRGVERASTSDLARLWKTQRGRCALTGRRLNRANAHLDHITAKARGGSDEVGNLRWLCVEANLAKRDLTDAEFAALCADVLRWIA